MHPQVYAAARKMMRVGDLIAIMEEGDFDRDDTIDTDSLEFEATQVSSCPKRLDLSKGGLSRIPDSAIAFPAIEELILGYNQFTNVDNNLKLLHRFPKLHAVHLESNDLRRIPRELLELPALTYLNLSDNKIEIIPADIRQLVKCIDGEPKGELIDFVLDDDHKPGTFPYKVDTWMDETPFNRIHRK